MRKLRSFVSYLRIEPREKVRRGSSYRYDWRWGRRVARGCRGHGCSLLKGVLAKVTGPGSNGPLPGGVPSQTPGPSNKSQPCPGDGFWQKTSNRFKKKWPDVKLEEICLGLGKHGIGWSQGRYRAINSFKDGYGNQLPITDLGRRTEASLDFASTQAELLPVGGYDYFPLPPGTGAIVYTRTLVKLFWHRLSFVRRNETGVNFLGFPVHHMPGG